MLSLRQLNSTLQERLMLAETQVKDSCKPHIEGDAPKLEIIVKPD